MPPRSRPSTFLGGQRKRLDQHRMHVHTARRATDSAHRPHPGTAVAQRTGQPPTSCGDRSRRIEETTGRSWLEAVGKELHFSECTLYGVYTDEFEWAKDVRVTSDSLCYSYWDNVPLTADGADALLFSVGSHDVAHDRVEVEHTPRLATIRARAAVRVLKRATHRPEAVRPKRQRSAPRRLSPPVLGEASSTFSCGRWVLYG
jgi:hypothetical protein